MTFSDVIILMEDKEENCQYAGCGRMSSQNLHTSKSKPGIFICWACKQYERRTGSLKPLAMRKGKRKRKGVHIIRTYAEKLRYDLATEKDTPENLTWNSCFLDDSDDETKVNVYPFSWSI